jgi:hypothetical protein
MYWIDIQNINIPQDRSIQSKIIIIVPEDSLVEYYGGIKVARSTCSIYFTFVI